MLSGIKRGKRKRSTSISTTTTTTAAASASAPTPFDPSTIVGGHRCRGDDDNGGGDSHDDVIANQPGVVAGTSSSTTTTTTTTTTWQNDHVHHHGAPSNNQTAAEALRRSLPSGVKPSFPSSSSSSSSSRRPNNHNDNGVNGNNNGNPEDDFALNRLERRGRIITIRDASHHENGASVDRHAEAQAEAETTIVLPSLPPSIPPDSHCKSKSARARRIHRETIDRDLSVSEMRRREIRSHRHDDVDADEIHARNILRLGKSDRDALSALHRGGGADEDDATGEMAHLVHRLYRSNDDDDDDDDDDRLARRKRMQRETSRQLARRRGMERFTRRSSWWVESPSFEKRYLIALGEKVSLVMIPSHETLSLNGGQDEGGDDFNHSDFNHSDSNAKSKSHSNSNTNSKEGLRRTKIQSTCPYPCRIVPLSHAESISSLDEDSWYEVRRFRQSLRRMYQHYGRGVLFVETVGGGKTGLQAKMEMVPVPRWVEKDAPMYFKHALAEAAQEWGVHGRSPISVTDDYEGGDRGGGRGGISANSNTKTEKTSRNAVPKGFPYFYVGWEGGGYVQLIETDDQGGGDDGDLDGNGGSAGLGGMGLGAGGGGGGGRGNSNAFWRDFGMDTIAGMMGLDPLKFRRRPPATDGDKARILEFCDKWKEFDWTLELD